MNHRSDGTRLFRTGALLAALGLAGAAEPLAAQAPITRGEVAEFRAMLESFIGTQEGRLAALQRQVDNVTFFVRLQDIALVDLVSFFGPPHGAATEPRSIRAFVFIPHAMGGADTGGLVVWPRGGPDEDIESWLAVPLLREMLSRGQTVIAPQYAGGPEERLDAVVEFALKRYPYLDAGRVQWYAPAAR